MDKNNETQQNNIPSRSKIVKDYIKRKNKLNENISTSQQHHLKEDYVGELEK